MLVDGYFTIERNIRGLTTKQIESKLGFRNGRLTHGARILVLDREPFQHEYEPMGSTLFPGGEGLKAQTKFRPGAWLGQRLVKVEPDLPHSGFEWYPPALGIGVQQWKLTTKVPAHEVCRLKAGDKYWV